MERKTRLIKLIIDRTTIINEPTSRTFCQNPIIAWIYITGMTNVNVTDRRAPSKANVIIIKFKRVNIFSRCNRTEWAIVSKQVFVRNPTRKWKTKFRFVGMLKCTNLIQAVVFCNIRARLYYSRRQKFYSTVRYHWYYQFTTINAILLSADWVFHFNCLEFLSRSIFSIGNIIYPTRFWYTDKIFINLF